MWNAEVLEKQALSTDTVGMWTQPMSEAEGVVQSCSDWCGSPGQWPAVLCVVLCTVSTLKLSSTPSILSWGNCAWIWLLVLSKELFWKTVLNIVWEQPVFNYLICDLPWHLKFNKQCIQHSVVSDFMISVAWDFIWLELHCVSHAVLKPLWICAYCNLLNGETSCLSPLGTYSRYQMCFCLGIRNWI